MKKVKVSLAVEIIGAIGVIASLIYLGIQIKQNTKVARAEITKDLYLASREAILDIATNDHLNSIWSDLRNFENDNAARQWSFYQSFFRLYELQHVLDEQELLEDNIAHSYSLVIQMFAKTEPFAEYWKTSQNTFNPNFVEYVNEQIEIVIKQKDSLSRDKQ